VIALPPAPRVLLVRLREIGDVVFTTPAVQAIRQRFPDSHIAYVVEPLAAPVVTASPHLNELIVAPRAGLFSDLALGRRLRHGRFDLAIDFHGGPRASLLTWFSSAPVRIGYDVPGRAWMYTERVPRPRKWRPRHAVENQWDLLATIGIGSPDPDAFPVEMRSDPAATHGMTARLGTAGVRPTDRLIVIHVSAGNPFRRWPPHAFATVVTALISRVPHAYVIVTSGPSEHDAAGRVVEEAWARLLPEQRTRVWAPDDVSLAELRALLDRAALYIGGDSGPLHIAATSPVPIVGLYGPTLPVRSAPWRGAHLIDESVEIEGLECRPCDQRVCAPGDFRCLTHISAEQVIEAAERVLAADRRRPRSQIG
jgi:ADP-heptose:LPS heptosyltransferase